MSEAWKGGSTRAWRKKRLIVLERDGYRCRAHEDGWCGQAEGQHECDGHGPVTVTHAHHVYGRQVTGDDIRFIVASCRTCNLHIGTPDPPAPKPRRVTRW